MIFRLTSLSVLSLILVSCSAITGADLTTQPQPNSPTTLAGTTPSTTTEPSVPGLAVVPEGGANLYSGPDGAVTQTVHEGIVLPVTGAGEDWLEVLDTCSNPAWVSTAEVDVAQKATPGVPGPGFDVASAVVVVDAGHGGRDWGAPGPSGTRESWTNLDIADRLRDLLLQSHDIDWETGRIGPGDAYPAIAAAWMTRDTIGPEDGDFEAGLAYRATMANSVAADALLALHNNTSPDRTVDHPPTAVFYAASVEDSDRLASLIHEEMLRSFEPFASEWAATASQGVISRVDPTTGTDYYGLLRRSEVPAVIVEGAFITDPVQEDLLESTVFRQAYAEGVYRGLIRFLTTEETGSTINSPVDFQGNVGSPGTSSCVVPTQPES